MTLLHWSTGAKRDSKSESEKLLELLKAKLFSFIIESRIELGDATVWIDRKNILPFFTALKTDPQLSLSFFVDVTAVDWLDQREQRFELVYHLLSMEFGHRLCVKAAVPEEEPEVDSLTPLWRGADFMEREVWDMFGIRFKGHPNLRRILLYEEFKGYPLRKDYPLQGKQPRVRLRYPEVLNTARQMARPELVSINRRPKE